MEKASKYFILWKEETYENVHESFIDLYTKGLTAYDIVSAIKEKIKKEHRSPYIKIINICLL